jgi:cellulose synthase/poly-beta-1,6-N-acetylglucosamine synthase-like glycosyltransferase
MMKCEKMLIETLRLVAFLCWFMFMLWAILGLLCLRYKPQKSTTRANNVELVIVSIANGKVRNSLKETLSNIEKLGLKFYLLVDESSELIPELADNNLVVVPKSYNQFLIGKGRAVNYFVEHYVQDKKWYGFVDDDNLVLDDTFLYEIPYYDKKGFAAMNPVLVMRKGKSSLTYVMDSIRLFDDGTVYKFFTGLLGKPLIGLHGELLCVKGEVLKEIGYNHRTITEDFRFSCELVKRGYKTWQSKTRISLKSPNNVSDLMRQRGRWFKGIVKDLKHATAPTKLIVGTRLSFWVLGFFGSWAFAFLWPLWGPLWPAIPGGIAYWLLYCYGVAKASKWRFLLAIPLIGIMETLSWVYSLRQKGFVVIDKR